LDAYSGLASMLKVAATKEANIYKDVHQLHIDNLHFSSINSISALHFS
jgi:hypothetical protein